MPTNKRLYLALAVVGCLGVVLIIPSCRGLVFGYLRFEPVHKGMPLSYWAARAQYHKMFAGPHDDGSRERHEGFDALVAIGPASVPALVAMMQTNDDWAVRYEAASSLGELESKAQAAVPVRSTHSLAKTRNQQRIGFQETLDLGGPIAT